ncbi:rab3 GTPase-activating protein catalytic subunit isoform X2 [Ipomoea triloba]|uniref:rab3 GTPase-activating protein catalytic subunit isoform X2 n=1 Tax=Ipomoea triloba TaxID=35885 RepID=UPI00125CE550|nr:rab3 GTPase-activating protein catalytic subunit isoform X2 [Ipomoea triloba]
MASTSKGPTPPEDDNQEEAFEHFDDFTLASTWERFISEIEAVCRQWLADGPRNLLKKGAVCLDAPEGLYKVKSDLKYASRGYLMEYYFETNNDGKMSDWTNELHDLQLSFGVKDFLVIAPQSASGVLLDRPEATKLLSAVAIALSNCSSLWPAFVPVHDPSRKAYIGIQNMGTLFTRRFEADRIGSQVPVKLMHLEGLFELFVSKFAFNLVDLSMHLFKVNFKMKLTYKSLPIDDEDDIEEIDAEVGSDGSPKSNSHSKTQWDDYCPWSEWYTAEDPIKGFELHALWFETTVGSSLDMAELENASPLEAEKWLISPNLSEAFGGNGRTIGFASQLRLLVAALDKSFEAEFMEDFVSVENSGSESLKSTAVVPPPTVLDRVLKDLFSEAIAVLWIEFVREVRWCWEESQPLPRMPADGVIDLSTSLVNQKLHMLSICINKIQQHNQRHQKDSQNKDILYAHVKEGNLVQSEIYPDGIMQGSCEEQDRLPTSDGSCDAPSALTSESPDTGKLSNQKPSEHIRRGSAGVAGSTMLLKSHQSMHTPYTQDLPLMTEDMHEERLQAVEAFSDSFSFSAQPEKEILSSDMSAFKAANPDAVFEDFIRWHSPRDWESDDNDAMEGSNKEWPPRGRLSERMSEKGNAWRKIWNEAPPLPASEQKPLLDPNREGEKALHYLETLQPHQLLEQMICTSFRAAADTLNQATFGALKPPMATKIDQLYLTLASSLRCFQKNDLFVDAETIDDLKRLSSIFEHVEKLVTLAVSLHRKFMHAPRLSEAIFNDYINFYIPKMGTASAGGGDTKEFTKKQLVRRREREIVASMFTPPTANQSWRKVLSMGNLLNGHEPILREIIFSKSEQISGSYYATNTPRNYDQDIETYRMYICGTSNDLSIALAVTSCD